MIKSCTCICKLINAKSKDRWWKITELPQMGFEPVTTGLPVHINHTIILQSWPFHFEGHVVERRTAPTKIVIYVVRWYIRSACTALTCSELSIANVHANMSVLFSSANGPMIHVKPKSGSKITVLFTVVLFERHNVYDNRAQLLIVITYITSIKFLLSLLPMNFFLLRIMLPIVTTRITELICNKLQKCGPEFHAVK